MDKGIPIFDCDIHPMPSPECPLDPYVPQEFRTTVSQGQANMPKHGYQNPFGVKRRDADCSTPEQLVELHLDRYNILYGLLQPPGIGVSLTHSIDVGNAMAQAWNDWHIGTYLEHDERLLGSICVNVNDPAAAAREIHRMGSHPRMVQVVVTAESNFLYGHRYYFPVYEACVEEGLVFALHPGQEGSLRSSTPIGRPSSYFEWHCDIPLSYQAHLTSMVSEGIFEKFPDLKVLLVECGISWLPGLMWRMDKNFKALRSTTPWLKMAPSEYILEHVRVSTQPIEEPENPDDLLAMYSIIRAEKTVCFATDFPHWDFDDPRRALPPRTPAHLVRRILYENALELFKLSLPESALLRNREAARA